MKAHSSFGSVVAITTGFTMAMLVAAPTILTLGYYAAPSLQGRLYPVVDVTLIGQGRQNDIGYWELSMHKRYGATLGSIDYYVRTSTRQHIPVRAFRCNTDNLERLDPPGPTHRPGDVWTTRYCIVITPDLDSGKGVQIEGYSTYRSWPYWWDTQQQTIGLTLPGHQA